MSPTFSTFYFANGDLADIVVQRDDSMNTRVRQYATHFFWRQRRVPVAIAQYPISRVVGVCTQPQMLNVDTVRSIATVQYMQVSRRKSSMRLPTRSRREKTFTTADTYPAPATRIDIANEIYAAVRARLASMCETLFQGHAAWCSFELSHDDAPSSLEVRARIGAENATSPEHYHAAAYYAT